ncbi:hypothetical protein RvY_10620-2 [Ramazzottius varieornatus]|nr:hypothetical protein RvY_10620-2 [Ramazzottius varieornatus]
MWNTLTFHPKPVVSLPHPGFVYCASFHPQNSSVVASGCYDGVIRTWSIDVEKSTYTLLQELTGHVGLINVVIFDRSGDQLYSGGSDGLIRQWSKDSSPGSAPLFDYRITNTTPTGLSQNVIIVDLKIRNEAKQLISTTQSGELSFVDLHGFVLLRQISFSQPFKYRIRGALTPDEKRLYVGSAQSEVQIVDLDTAKLIQTTGSGLSCGVPVDIDYHPTQHLITFCALGVGEKVIVRITSKPKQDLPGDPDQLSLPPERSLTTSPSGSSHPDKVSELIRKLDAITDDMKQREQLRSRTPLATHIRTSANRWRLDLSYSSVGGPVLSGAAPNGPPSKFIAGLMPNFSQIGVPAQPDY